MKVINDEFKQIFASYEDEFVKQKQDMRKEKLCVWEKRNRRNTLHVDYLEENENKIWKNRRKCEQLVDKTEL